MRIQGLAPSPATAASKPCGSIPADGAVAWLTLDPRRTPLSCAALFSRLPPHSAQRLFELAGHAGAPCDARLRQHSLSTLYAAACRGLFGADAARPLRLWPLRARMAQAGLAAEWEAMAAALSPRQARTLRRGQTTPDQLFGRRALALGDVWQCRAAVPAAALRQLDAAAFAALLAAADPAERRALRAHGLSPLALRQRRAASQRRHADVVVVGAGAAGIAAALALREAGLRVTVLEATARLGGRAHTAGLGHAVDLGAEHLHSGAHNPLTGLCAELGFTLVPAPAGPGLAFTGRAPEAPQAQGLALEAARQRLLAQLERCLPRSADCSVAACLPPPDLRMGAWDLSARARLGELEMGTDLAHVSSQDMVRIMPERQGDLAVAEGLGTAIETLATGLPVEHGRTVTRIDYGPQGCTTWVGTEPYVSRRVLLTVPLGLLQRGSLRLEPPLPPRHAAALAQLPMAAYEKIVLRFDAPVFGDVAPGTCVQVAVEPQHAIDFILRPPVQRCGPPETLAIAYVGGALAARLAQAPAEVTAYALQRLSLAFGPQVLRHLRHAHPTAWGNTAGGAYTAALPGGHGARNALRQPIAGVLYLAGEACDEALPDGHSWCTQAPGAWRSGVATAARLQGGLTRGAPTLSLDALATARVAIARRSKE